MLQLLQVPQLQQQMLQFQQRNDNKCYRRCSSFNNTTTTSATAGAQVSTTQRQQVLQQVLQYQQHNENKCSRRCSSFNNTHNENKCSRRCSSFNNTTKTSATADAPVLTTQRQQVLQPVMRIRICGSGFV